MKRMMLAVALVVAGCGGTAAATTPGTPTIAPTDAPPTVAPAPRGVVVFGTVLDTNAMTVTTPVTTATATTPVGWIAYLSDSANATTITVIVATVSASGTETSVGNVDVAVSNPKADQFAHAPDTVLGDLGAATYVIRYIRPSDTKVLAEGTFTITP